MYILCWTVSSIWQEIAERQLFHTSGFLCVLYAILNASVILEKNEMCLERNEKRLERNEKRLERNETHLARNETRDGSRDENCTDEHITCMELMQASLCSVIHHGTILTRFNMLFN